MTIAILNINIGEIENKNLDVCKSVTKTDYDVKITDTEVKYFTTSAHIKFTKYKTKKWSTNLVFPIS